MYGYFYSAIWSAAKQATMYVIGTFERITEDNQERRTEDNQERITEDGN